MSIKLNPYLNFNGDTKEAMEFYKSVFGGELTLSTFGENPGMPVPPGYEDKIMHASLDSDEITLMASEGRPGEEVKVGNNVNLSLSGNDHDKLTAIFEKLAEGGQVTMPLATQSWGDVFGMCVDKYSINWLVNINKA